MKTKTTFTLLVLLASVAVGACERPKSQEADAEKKSEPPQIAQTAALVAAHGSQGLAGVATILNPDPLLQIDADLRAATISADFSRGTLGRYKSTTALSRQTVENAERQAGTDNTQQKLLETRLRHTWGEDAPFLDAEHRQKLVAELTAGTRAIVRMDFPDLTSGTPQNVRVAPLAGGTPVPVKTLWIAPSGNLSMPGVSYFGLIEAGPGLRAGDRARLLADSAESASGVIVPSSAIVIYAGQSWCYIETAPGKYERRTVALDLPMGDGYLVKEGFDPKMRVVVRGASLLLSREAGPGEDDDDGASKSPAAKPAADDDDKPAPSKPSAATPVETPTADKTSGGDKDSGKPASDKSEAAETAKSEKPPAADPTPDDKDDDPLPAKAATGSEKPHKPSALAAEHGGAETPNTDHD